MLAPQQSESVFLRPANIASRRFTRAMPGYDPEEVHQFLEDVADYLSRLEGELEWRRALRTRPSGTIGEQREAINVVTAAREQAERILAEARKEAEGFTRLARAIAHQLALESQARRPQVALAVTRASGSSATVEGIQGFEDMEVWVDASVFDLTKPEEPPTAGEGVTSDDATDTDVATSDETAKPEASASGEAETPHDVVPGSEEVSGEVAATENGSASADVSASQNGSATAEVSSSENGSATTEVSASHNGSGSAGPVTPQDAKSNKKSRKRRKLRKSA